MNSKEDEIFKIITRIINIILCLLLPFSILIAMVSPMMFDAPGSNESFYTWILFISNFSAPVIILISIIISIYLLKLKLYKRAFIFSLLPLINLITILVAYWGITVFQNGKFSIY
ncbi:hypothetical protein [Clostridium senegalense]|uniref:hypothetical protein n=1 Tax=Clostridium senegalense TaxID=1465809 RepID=UPI001C120E84|nr:hypothetical protein [Clostridium senegalense]MBU5225144.1 hypothetical protein [Clostridium senegalense]